MLTLSHCYESEARSYVRRNAVSVGVIDCTTSSFPCFHFGELNYNWPSDRRGIFTGDLPVPPRAFKALLPFGCKGGVHDK